MHSSRIVDKMVKEEEEVGLKLQGEHTGPYYKQTKSPKMLENITISLRKNCRVLSVYKSVCIGCKLRCIHDLFDSP